MSILVSFIIPCYNEASYIKNCINSIRHQDIDPTSYEIIVVDNGSRDGTDVLASELGAIVLTNPRRGAAASRNMGALHAKGEILAFVDADCILGSTWVTKLSNHLEKPHVCAVAAPAIPIEAGMTWVEKAWSKVFVCFPRNVQSDAVRASNLASSNMLIRTRIFKEVGGFDEGFLSCEDYDLSQRLLKIGILLIDNSIIVTHLRESKTVAELFRREVARGRYSLRCFVKNGYNIHEIPSIAIPLIVMLIPILSVVHVIKGNYYLFIIQLVTLIIFPVVYILRSSKKLFCIKDKIQEYIVASTYVVARSTAMAKELYDIFIYVFGSLKGVKS